MDSIQINLSNEEAGILKDVLSSFATELSSEIANTDSFDFREELKKRRIVLHKIINLVNDQLPK